MAPIYWSLELQHWTVGFGGAFVPYHTKVITRTLEEATPSFRLAAEALITAGRATPTSMQFQAEPFVLLPEGYAEALEKCRGNREEVFAHIMLDSHDEIMMLIQACSVINCANVSMGDISAPAALNKKRQEKGKQPFFLTRCYNSPMNDVRAERVMVAAVMRAHARTCGAVIYDDWTAKWSGSDRRW